MAIRIDVVVVVIDRVHGKSHSMHFVGMPIAPCLLLFTSAVLGHEFGPEIIGHEKNHALKDIWGSHGRKKNHTGSVGYRPALLRESCPPRGMENALSKIDSRVRFL